MSEDCHPSASEMYGISTHYEGGVDFGYKNKPIYAVYSSGKKVYRGSSRLRARLALECYRTISSVGTAIGRLR